MDKIIERIKEAYLFETDAQVAEFLDLKPNTLSMQKNRGRLNLKRIIEKCSDLNKNWLLDGTGPMRINEEESVANINEIPVYSSFTFHEDNEPDLQHSLKTGSLVVNIPKERDLFSVEDSLIGYAITEDVTIPALQKDDIAFFDLKNKNPNDDSIFLITYNGQVICRRLQKKGESYIVRRDNDGQEVFKISKSNNGFNIIGEMIGILRDLGTSQEH